MTELLTVDGTGAALTARYEHALMNTFGAPKRVLVRGEGCYVWDADGRKYLDLLGGLAVNSLGHAHPFVAVRGDQSARHPRARLELLRQPRRRSRSPSGCSACSTPGTAGCSSPTPAPRRTRRRSSSPGAPAGPSSSPPSAPSTAGRWARWRSPGSRPTGRRSRRCRVTSRSSTYGDAAALAAAVDDDTAAVVLEPIQGENGVVIPPAGYLAAARQITCRHGALLWLDEVQTGIGRTGAWFAHTAAGVTAGRRHGRQGSRRRASRSAPASASAPTADLLGPGSHGTTFGGNPVAAIAGLAVLERDRAGRPARQCRCRRQPPAQRRSRRSATRWSSGVRGAGLLLAITLTAPVAEQVADAALEAGFIVNDVTPDAIRLAPPLILTKR